jgi:protein-S-isoprenylcysteine O-methyltransferase Ste14
MTLMDNVTSPEKQPPQPVSIPRWLAVVLAPIVWLIALPAVHAGVPWALSHLGPRYGWTDHGPSGWNQIGYIFVSAGAILLVWIMIFELSQRKNMPDRVPIDWSPAFLMTGGPYALSRNPMYIGELALWLGMAVLFGSPVVLAGFVVWMAVMRRLVVREETGLEVAYGDLYRRYKSQVPRWIGLPRHARSEIKPDASANRKGG